MGAVRRALLGAPFALALVAFSGAGAAAPSAVPVLEVREVRQLSIAKAGVANPGALVFAPSTGSFYALPARRGSTLARRFGILGGAGSVWLAGSAAGRAAAFDARGRQLVFFEDRANRFLAAAVTRSGKVRRPLVRSRVAELGNVRAVGLALDRSSRTLFLLDGRSGRIAVIPASRWQKGRAGAGSTVRWIELAGLRGRSVRGLAFDLATRRFSVLDARTREISTYDQAGALVRTLDASTVGLRDPRSLVAAPSGDQTDDPSTTSLYIADVGGGGSLRVVEVAETTTTALSASASSASLVNTIETWRWSPASPDPSGLGYDTASGRLLVVDGEVDEMSIYAGANYYESTLSGSLVRTSNTLGFSNEPVGTTFNPAGRVFVSDDDQRRIFEIALGSDGQFGTGDAVVGSFSTSALGIGDPEGLSYDSAGNRLFVADGVNAEIYEIRPVDGVFGNGNDQVLHFDTSVLGVVDPEAVEFKPDTGTLYTIGDDGTRMIEVTTSGTLVAEIDTSAAALDRPAGIAYAPRSTDPTKMSVYVADRKVDNDGHPSENDGTIYELAIGEPSTQPPPSGDVRVAASGDDAEEAPSGSVALTSSDLELVTDGTSAQSVGLRFARLGVPAGATVTNAYIQFTADEAQSVATSLTLRAQAADNAAAFTTAAFNVSSRPRTTASVAWSPGAWAAGEAGAAQRTPNLTALVQEVISRPGWTSGNAITFVVTGTGHRTAVAFDGGAARAPLLHVEVGEGTANEPPTVDAGPDQAVTLPSAAMLDGSVSDDGVPNATPTTMWSKVSGPGTVTFANASVVDTQASFSAAGTYVLRLTADDGQLSASDDVTITVSPPASGAVEIRVPASSDDAEENPKGAVKPVNGDLELVTDRDVQTVGLRFPALSVPRGATITNAYIQFSADEAQSVATSLTLRAQAGDNAATFTATTFNVSSRPRTAASVAWSPPAWTAGAAAAGQRTPGLASLVQEVVNRPGWTPGNAIAFVVTGTGHRTAVAYDGNATRAPLLHVDYTS